MDYASAIIALVGAKGWVIFHMDVDTAFLNGKLNDIVYMNQPLGFMVIGKDHFVYFSILLSMGFNNPLVLGMTLSMIISSNWA